MSNARRTRIAMERIADKIAPPPPMRFWEAAVKIISVIVLSLVGYAYLIH